MKQRDYEISLFKPGHNLHRKVNMVIIIITMTMMGQEANKLMSNKEKKKSKGNTKPAPKK